MKLVVERTWDDHPAGVHVEVALRRHTDQLIIDVDAPFFDDPAPSGPPGPSPELWRHEVVEVFFLGSDERYLEVELSPRGHHLVLELHGVREVVRQGMPLDFTATIDGERWRGRARVPLVWLPPRWDRVNAYAIHGTSQARRYLAWRATGGDAPDFHRLEAFGAVDLDLRLNASPGSPSSW